MLAFSALYPLRRVVAGCKIRTQTTWKKCCLRKKYNTSVFSLKFTSGEACCQLTPGMNGDVSCGTVALQWKLCCCFQNGASCPILASAPDNLMHASYSQCFMLLIVHNKVFKYVPRNPGLYWKTIWASSIRTSVTGGQAALKDRVPKMLSSLAMCNHRRMLGVFQGTALIHVGQRLDPTSLAGSLYMKCAFEHILESSADCNTKGYHPKGTGIPQQANGLLKYADLQMYQ
ncbi:uncharacterized protein LOC133387757 isoform X2 [Rhineura floridana]|uniref:uncharacterized protein LOC133387757 isoform X2 n=1 Tax=Rhineura floridana TaxID=261503 RepID=UPI002AC84F8A|nr:uncharacterized protein LOC133387757 isoform X2 [Rhineura floridana]